MSYPVMTDEEMKWRARSDARTLAEAEEIKADKSRYKKALSSATEIYNERAKELQGISKIVKKSAPVIGRHNNNATVGRL